MMLHAQTAGGRTIPAALAMILTLALAGGTRAEEPSTASAPPPVSERALAVHAAGMLFDGHNDFPWLMRAENDLGMTKFDFAKQVDVGQTDIPRLRKGGLKAQFWSVYIPSEHPNPTKTVVEQMDFVNRLVEKHPDDLQLALTADDVEAAVKAGKIASLMGIEGGVAIDDSFAELRAFYRLGARYMTLTHNKTLAWADAATGERKHGGLSPFGERIVAEMNRLGMLVDISHVSAETMADVLRVAQAPVIASHSSAFALCPVPRNVPDEILTGLKANGGVVMVNFYSAFLVPDSNKNARAAKDPIRKAHPDKADRDKALADWYRNEPGAIRGTVATVVDHIDHIVKVAGVDHVGIGSDFDGIDSWPVGLDDVSDYPRITEELLRRGYSETDVHKILGGNALRALRDAEAVARRLQETTPPQVDDIRHVKKPEDE
ncbi:dipeptidase [Planctomyces sp. SH-PL62]|uniref:dipeptidase n=1 Tax=Planctomyces sp. SH-PL62 TaxID=1636152 RepID=UPI00078E7D35|nr:dipeptidase [Planctomyces sp. SH-PL62]AMV36287.1 Membrane dipeptidase (Peptidase family M19) [Planctomyces sp. SH-PL62]